MMEKQGNILGKLHAIQLDVKAMVKDGQNASQGYKYLSEAQITEVFKDLLEKNKVMFLYSSRITGTQPNSSGKQILTAVEVEYTFYDVESGESFKGVAAGQGSDPNDKGVYKAITGAIKYIFMKTFLIPTGDDPENDVGARSRKAMDEGRPPFGKDSDED